MRQFWKHVLIVGCLICARFIANAQTFTRSYDIPVESEGILLENAWSGGLNSCQFSEIDLNEDGKMDLFVFDRVGNRICTFLNESLPGESRYRYTRDFQGAFPAGLKNWVFLRDFNCDGKQDIVSNSQSGMKIWYNTSSGGVLSFEPAMNGSLIQAFYDIGSNPFLAPIYTISPDLPSFDDYDGDGDIDVFSFTETSVGMYFFKSMQVENEDCSQISFTCANRCYGMFNESPESFDIFKGDEFQCDFNVNNPRSDETGPLRHTGGTVLQLDLDQNGIKDLVIGDVTEPNLLALTMEDAEDGQDSAVFCYPDFPFAFGGADPVNLILFPGAFYLDIDQDGVKDLISAPNSAVEAADRQSIWVYHNEGLNDLPSFQFVQTDFLQNEMIDHGLGAYPVVSDINSDNLPDLLVANREYYSDSEQHTSRIWYYRNNGSSTQPSFILDDQNWLSVPEKEWDSVYPSFADVDGDGDQDMAVGELQGFVHLFENIAAPGEPAVYAESDTIRNALTDLPIDVGQYATPQFIDMDGDELVDLVIGEKGGNINYYRNAGTEFQPEFQFVEDTLGDVVATSLLGILGYSVPCFFYNSGNELELWLGTETGQINHYTNITGNLNGTFELVTPDFAGINEGARCAVFRADLNDDEQMDLLVGQIGGGLGIYLAEGITPEVEEIPFFGWKVYPNPSDEYFFIGGLNSMASRVEIEVLDPTGRKVFSSFFNASSFTLDASGWTAGWYILRLTGPEGMRCMKLVVR
jgi:hypothetical protein